MLVWKTYRLLKYGIVLDTYSKFQGMWVFHTYWVTGNQMYFTNLDQTLQKAQQFHLEIDWHVSLIPGWFIVG